MQKKRERMQRLNKQKKKGERQRRRIKANQKGRGS